MTASLRAEDRQRDPRSVEAAHEVHVDHALHDVDGRLLGPAVVPEAGVTDHDIDRAEPIARAFHHPTDVRLHGDVCDDRVRAPAGGADLVDRLRQSLFAARAEHDGRASPGELARAGESNPRGCPGDRRDPSLQIHSA
jgi:hypothetical protein